MTALQTNNRPGVQGELDSAVRALAAEPLAFEVIALAEHLCGGSRSRGFSLGRLGGWAADLDAASAEAGLRRLANEGLLREIPGGESRYLLTQKGRAVIAECLPKDNDYMGDLFFIGECFKDFRYWQLNEDLAAFRRTISALLSKHSAEYLGSRAAAEAGELSELSLPPR